DLIKAVTHWKIILPGLLMAGYTALVVYGLAKVDLWKADQAKDTAFWFLFAGLAVAFSAIDSARRQRHFWRRIVLDQIKITVLVEWLFASYTFPLVAELLLVPAIALLVMLDVVAQSKPEFSPAAKITSAALAIGGFVLFGFTLRQAVIAFTLDESGAAARSIALAPILSVAILPFIYFLVLIT